MEVAAQNGLNNNGMPGPLAAVAEDQGNFTSDDVTPPPAVPVPPANGDVPDNGPNPLDLINPQQFLNLVNGGNIPLPDDALSIDSAFVDSNSAEEDSMDIPDFEVPPLGSKKVEDLLHHYRFRHGRRWNRDGEYILPTDSPEVHRLESQHRLCLSVLNKELHLTKVRFRPNARILDIGTSSGIWAIEMAEKHPQAQVIGLDISPQQKPHVTIPANCSFILHDIRNRLPFRDNCFDFVHMRDMQSAVAFSWEILLREINRILVPGGWVQFAEFIYQHSTESRSPEVKSKLRDSPIGRLETRFIEAARITGRTIIRPGVLPRLVGNAGNFVPASEQFIRIPIGCYGTNARAMLLGGQMLSNVIEGVESFGVPLLMFGGYPEAKANKMITSVVKQYQDCSWMLSMEIVYCAVQKLG